MPQVKVLDTSLRDGQQCPGAGMNVNDNLAYAELAYNVGIDILEAGFPSASKTDFGIVHTIAKELAPRPHSPIIAALCQLRQAQIETTINALQPALSHQKARLHAYLPVDPHLLKASLGELAENKQHLVEEVYRLLSFAAQSGIEIQFSPEGYSRMGENFAFATDVIRAAISAGANIINCPDTIGGACWLQGEDYFVNHMRQHAEMFKLEFPERQLTWSVHCHNDFGLAVTNTVHAIFNGPARQFEGCFNGIGERAGNAALEQCLMIIKHFAEFADAEQALYTRIHTEKLQAISDFVHHHMLPRQPHWPITGSNAALHTSGGHTNAILHDPLAYQPFDPRETGNKIGLLFGPMSGGNHVKAIIEGFAYRCDDAEKAEIAQYIKDFYADRRKGVTDREVLHAYMEYRKPIHVTNFNYTRDGQTISLTLQGKFFTQQGQIVEQFQGSNSSLAALLTAITRYLPNIKIHDYRSSAATQGINSQSISKIVIQDENDAWFKGHGEDQDIEISAMIALVDAVNHAYIDKQYKLEGKRHGS